MTETLMKRSPVHHLLQSMQPEWSTIGGMPVALRFTSEVAEQAALEAVGLCDLSCLCKSGLKGPDASSWLAEQGIELPAKIYETSTLEDGGLIVRLGTDEFLLESGIANKTVPALEAKPLPVERQVCRVHRQDATFVLCGPRGVDVLAQTCGIDFREAPLRRLALTRVAGVNCGVLPDIIEERRLYRIWVDPSFAVSLWESLSEICADLDGGVIGLQMFYPDVS